ncbi:MAG: response regulator [Nitrosopumilus sp.]|nr:response regulator [Nitrosopumilus sp.]MDH3502774.1 response regulator [Nitrosopumilus sp.]
MSNPSQKMNILLIDDNPHLVSVFANLLRIKGFSVTTETTFKEGLKHLNNETYDTVFVDAPLDDYDENHILTLFQKNQVFQKTFVFLFSAIDFDKIELNKWKKHGLYSFLKKPVKHNVIIKALDDLRMKKNLIASEITSQPIIKNTIMLMHN